MIRSIFDLLILLALLVAVGVVPATADDTLGDFEDGIEKREQKNSKRRNTNNADYTVDSDDDDAADEFAGNVLGAIFSGLFLSAGSTAEHFRSTSRGSPASAAVRLEGVYQSLTNTDVDGFTLRGEAVYAFIGVGGEYIRYHEDSPSQTLKFGSAEVLYRIAPSDVFSLTAALGARWVDGRDDRTGFSGGVSTGIYPTEWLGLEADLRWADLSGRTLGDYRAGLLFRVPAFPYVAVRGGYRWIKYQSETLDGAEVGAVLTW
jgi:hypothetical protein